MHSSTVVVKQQQTVTAALQPHECHRCLILESNWYPRKEMIAMSLVIYNAPGPVRNYSLYTMRLITFRISSWKLPCHPCVFSNKVCFQVQSHIFTDYILQILHYYGMDLKEIEYCQPLNIDLCITIFIYLFKKFLFYIGV